MSKKKPLRVVSLVEAEQMADIPIPTASELQDNLKRCAALGVQQIVRILCDENARDADKLNAAKLALNYGFPDLLEHAEDSEEGKVYEVKWSSDETVPTL